MGTIHTSVIDAPAGEVFEWHARPGALPRLLPPWSPVRVEREAGSLRDGTAVLLLPGGLRWEARHDPGGYDPPAQFVDELVSWPLRALPWRHVHRFEAAAGGRTAMTDRLESPLPAAVARSTFSYRHRQVAGDLAAHRWAAGRLESPLTVGVTGSTGLVGGALCAFLTAGGHRVVRLVRGAPAGPDERRWDPAAPAPGLLDGVDAVVHLAGASIAGRFTDSHMRQVRDTRIGPTRRLAELASRSATAAFVSASAIGYYGPDRGDERLTEEGGRGGGFLAGVVADWEAAAAPASDAGVRTVHVRTGIVQSPRGGTLRLLRPLFLAGLGGRIGWGRQWMSWIGIDDLVDVYHRALVDREIAGPLNAVAPEPVRNDAYTRTLARVLNRPALLPVPELGPQLLLGRKGAAELAMADQRVEPRRLLDAGHRFRHPDLETALRHVLGRDPVPAD